MLSPVHTVAEKCDSRTVWTGL